MASEPDLCAFVTFWLFHGNDATEQINGDCTFSERCLDVDEELALALERDVVETIIRY